MSRSFTIQMWQDGTDVWAKVVRNGGAVIAKRFGPTQRIAIDRVKADVIEAHNENKDNRREFAATWTIKWIAKPVKQHVAQ
jgi:hypothetical protein